MPPMDDTKRISGRKKAATLLLCLGPDIASQVYRYMSDQEIEQITFEIANMGKIPQEISNIVIEEFYHTAMAKQYINHGGIGTAREILEKALGPARAMDIVERLQGILTGTPFDFLRHVDPQHLIDFVKNEHPQTIALVLAHLDYDNAAAILSKLPHEVQEEVAMRIATMDQTSPEIIAEIERILERKLSTILTQDFSHAGGIEALAELLNRLDQQSTKSIIQSLEDNNNDLATEVKQRMYTFDDLIVLDDKSLRKVLKEIDGKELAIALKGASEEIKNQIFGNISTRAAQDLKDEMDMMGPVRIKNVEESQQRICAILRKLQETGDIEMDRNGKEEMVD